MANKYQKTLDTIHGGTMSRAQLARLRVNAHRKAQAGDPDAVVVLEALDAAVPADEEYVFMGFCPGADFNNRLDVEWKRRGVLTFVFWESEQQRDRFESIAPGDLIILKKRQRFGETMQLFGFGRVRRRRTDEDGHSYLEMNWSAQERVIEVPLMACNSTIDVRTAERVGTVMPPEFFDWLYEPGDVIGARPRSQAPS